MKNAKIYLFLALSGFFAASCNDAIDIKQDGELVPEKAFETVGDLNTGLLGVYSLVPAEGYIYFTSVFTDETAIGASNGGQGVDLLLHNITAQSGTASGVWSGNYRLINNATRIIKAAENITYDESTESERLKHIVAQAYALRAFGHLQLMSAFTTDMKNPNALSVIKLDFIPSINDKLPRNTVSEVVDLILSDLDFAYDNLSTNAQLAPGATYIRKSFIPAIKARLYAYTGQYGLAEQFADQTISTSGTTLSAGITYQNIWRDLDAGEVIFKLERNASSVSGANFYQYWSSANSTVTGSPMLEVNRALFNLVNSSTDIRKNVIADVTSIINPNYAALSVDEYRTTDIIPVGKYSASKGINLLGDVKVIRLSEIYFIKAEARVAAGDLTGAAQAVFDVRSKRITGATMPVYNNATEAWADILKERRVELAFEGHRLLDIKRLGSLAGVTIDRDPQDCSAQGFPCDLPVTDYRFTLPIPASEINVNPSIRNQQNPGYAN